MNGILESSKEKNKLELPECNALVIYKLIRYFLKIKYFSMCQVGANTLTA